MFNIYLLPIFCFACTILRWIIIKFIPILPFVFQGFIEIIVLVVEIYIVQSYYKQQKLAAVSDFVQLKWKYLPNNKTQSGQNKSTVIIITKNQESQDESNYIPIFVKELRHVNAWNCLTKLGDISLQTTVTVCYIEHNKACLP